MKKPLYREPGFLEKEKLWEKFLLVAISLPMIIMLLFCTIASVWTKWFPGVVIFFPGFVLLSWFFWNFMLYSPVLVRTRKIRIRNYPMDPVWRFPPRDILSIKLPPLSYVANLDIGAPFTINAKGSIRVKFYVSRPASFLKALEAAGLERPLRGLLDDPYDDRFLRPKTWFRKALESLEESEETSEKDSKQLTDQNEYNWKINARILKALRKHQDGASLTEQDQEIVEFLLLLFGNMDGVNNAMEETEVS